jgi:hypothetical protein
MQLNEEFSLDTLPKSTNSFDPVPAGIYEVTITKAELKDNKAGTGQFISIRYDIVGPTHQGRVVFGNFNIKNASPKAEEIARQQLGELMAAIGINRVNDTDQLIGARLKIKVSIRLSEEYGPQNDIKGWSSVSGASIPKISETSESTTAATSKASPPWAKK